MKSVPAKNTPTKIERFDPLYKRWFDLGILLMAHLLLFPLWFFLWTMIPLAIYLDSGRPIFYRHPCIGWGGRLFERLKFRTMSDQAAKRLFYTEKADSRVTRVGKLLRKTAMDELPQVINILKGDMSFVGPRAIGVRMFEHSVSECPQFVCRLKVRPGLTSLAHVYSAPSDRLYLDPRKKLAYDRLYISRMSLVLDFWLMLLSVWRSVRGKWDG